MTRMFRLVGVLNEDSDEYHLYSTNLARDDYHASDITQLYRARWKIELLFKELKSRFGLDEINTTDPYIIEAVIIVVAISLLMNRVIMDELRKSGAKRQRGDDGAYVSSACLPCRRCSHTLERHVGTAVPVLNLGYELPGLDELLLWALRDPNPHRPRLREQVSQASSGRNLSDEPVSLFGGSSGGFGSVIHSLREYAVFSDLYRAQYPRQRKTHSVFRPSYISDLAQYCPAQLSAPPQCAIKLQRMIRNHIEKWFQTVAMRIDRFHSFW